MEESVTQDAGHDGDEVSCYVLTCDEAILAAHFQDFVSWAFVNTTFHAEALIWNTSVSADWGWSCSVESNSTMKEWSPAKSQSALFCLWYHMLRSCLKNVAFCRHVCSVDFVRVWLCYSLATGQCQAQTQIWGQCHVQWPGELRILYAVDIPDYHTVILITLSMPQGVSSISRLVLSCSSILYRFWQVGARLKVILKMFRASLTRRSLVVCRKMLKDSEDTL